MEMRQLNLTIYDEIIMILSILYALQQLVDEILLEFQN